MVINNFFVVKINVWLTSNNYVKYPQTAETGGKFASNRQKCLSEAQNTLNKSHSIKQRHLMKDRS